MSKRLILCLVVLSFVFLGNTFAAVENIKISGEINAETILRNLSLGDHNQSQGSSDNDHGFFISQIRLGFDADLTENISGKIGLLSERTWGENNSLTTGADDIQMEFGYIEMREFLLPSLTVKVGRQRLRYGNALIVGDPSTNQGLVGMNTGLPTIAQDLSWQKSFDSAKAVFDLAPWTIDLVFAQVDEGETNLKYDDEYLFGTNIAYNWAEIEGVSELYFFGADRTPQSTSVDPLDKQHVYVVGARSEFEPRDNIMLNFEGAYQFGDQNITTGGDNDHIKAWGAQFIGEYRFADKNKTKIAFDYTYLTGDNPKTPDTYEAWNPMWEDQSPAELMNVFLSQSNRSFAGFHVTTMPKEHILLGLRYAHAWLVEHFVEDPTFGPVITNTIGPVAGILYTINPGKLNLGDEVDVYGVCYFSEDIYAKLSGAFLFPGSVFASNNNSMAYSVRAGLTLNF